MIRSPSTVVSVSSSPKSEPESHMSSRSLQCDPISSGDRSSIRRSSSNISSCVCVCLYAENGYNHISTKNSENQRIQNNNNKSILNGCFDPLSLSHCAFNAIRNKWHIDYYIRWPGMRIWLRGSICTTVGGYLFGQFVRSGPRQDGAS